MGVGGGGARQKRLMQVCFFFSLCTTKAYWLNSFQASPPTMLYMLISHTQNTRAHTHPSSFCSVNSVVLSGQQPHNLVDSIRGGAWGGEGWMNMMGGCCSGEGAKGRLRVGRKTMGEEKKKKEENGSLVSDVCCN